MYKEVESRIPKIIITLSLTTVEQDLYIQIENNKGIKLCLKLLIFEKNPFPLGKLIHDGRQITNQDQAVKGLSLIIIAHKFLWAN